MADLDLSQELQARVAEAMRADTPLVIQGSGSKAFYGRTSQGEALDVSGHRGVVSYEPSELVVTVRAGTPLAELETLLAQRGQMLPFEPPHFGAATVGGTVAAGLSGPRRAWCGAVRDAVLGVRLINGRGEVLRFGGQVMKNVAGYDVSRLMAGALGTLGVLLEVSLKVLPRPPGELTLALRADADAARRLLIAWAAQPLPICATLQQGGDFHVRLCGGPQALAGAREVIGGDALESNAIWALAREQQLPFFLLGDAPLWRLSVPPTASLPELGTEVLHEWGGAQRWVRAPVEAVEALRALAARHGGHATLFRGPRAGVEPFQPLPLALMALHRRVKAAFDPHGLFNPGRLYAEF